jgi:hypothetical protein
LRSKKQVVTPLQTEFNNWSNAEQPLGLVQPGHAYYYRLSDLAVLTVSGAAFAQSAVTLTGKLRFAYGETKSTAGVKGNGGGMTDGDWNIAAVEDLGGGLKAGANMALRLRGRDAATDSLSGGSTTDGNGARPRDSSVYLTGGFGTITAGSIEAGNGLLPLLTAGGPNYIGLDTGVTLAAPSNVDILQYTSPSMSGFSLLVNTTDAIGTGKAENGGSAETFGVKYNNGPLSADVNMTSYGSAYGPAADSRTRISANYNLGMARVGAGFQSSKATTGVKKEDTAFSVSAPFGAFNVGVIYATSQTDGVAGTAKAYDFAVQYNLSKRTYLALQGQSIKAAKAGAIAATNTRVQLAHSF